MLSDKGRLLARTPPSDAPKGGNMRVARTASGELWLGGTWVGPMKRERWPLLKWDAHRLNVQQAKNVLAIKDEPQTGRVWSCYNGGLVVREKDGAWREFNAKDGLLEGGCWDFALLPNGDIWYLYFAQKAAAMIRFAPDGKISVRQYYEKDGLSDAGENASIAADQRGWLWRSGDTGIYVADAAEAKSRRMAETRSIGWLSRQRYELRKPFRRRRSISLVGRRERSSALHPSCRSRPSKVFPEDIYLCVFLGWRCPAYGRGNRRSSSRSLRDGPHRITPTLTAATR